LKRASFAVALDDTLERATEEALLHDIQKYAVTCPQIARFHPSWVTADTSS